MYPIVNKCNVDNIDCRQEEFKIIYIRKAKPLSKDQRRFRDQRRFQEIKEYNSAEMFYEDVIYDLLKIKKCVFMRNKILMKKRLF